jgi:hypothetical protein
MCLKDTSSFYLKAETETAIETSCVFLIQTVDKIQEKLMKACLYLSVYLFNQCLLVGDHLLLRDLGLYVIL